MAEPVSPVDVNARRRDGAVGIENAKTESDRVPHFAGERNACAPLADKVKHRVERTQLIRLQGRRKRRCLTRSKLDALLGHARSVTADTQGHLLSMVSLVCNNHQHSCKWLALHEHQRCTRWLACPSICTQRDAHYAIPFEVGVKRSQLLVESRIDFHSRRQFGRFPIEIHGASTVDFRVTGRKKDCILKRAHGAFRRVREIVRSRTAEKPQRGEARRQDHQGLQMSVSGCRGVHFRICGFAASVLRRRRFFAVPGPSRAAMASISTRRVPSPACTVVRAGSVSPKNAA